MILPARRDLPLRVIRTFLIATVLLNSTVLLPAAEGPSQYEEVAVCGITGRQKIAVISVGGNSPGA
jgi:hypothetical protein